MLIEFSLSNFRSFRERQTLQMTASSHLGKKQNTFKPDVDGEKLPSLLKVVAIYGGNASGKTSLLEGLQIAARLLQRDPETAASRQLPVDPFRFDTDLLDKPSYFEWHFIVARCRYQFRLAITRERVFEEALFVYPRGKEVLLYQRTFNEGGDEYKFGEEFEGGELLHTAWSRLTGPRSLFISQVVANSSEELTQLKAPFSWLKGGMMVFSGPLDTLKEFSRRLPEKEIWGREISGFLQELDVPVTNVRYEVESQSEGVVPQVIKDVINLKPLQKKGKTILTHETRLGKADFDFSEESKGTQNLMGLYVPWVILQYQERDSPTAMNVLAVDELDASLHPLIVEDIVKKQVSSESHSQLIFTAHDTHLMSAKILRRDQFWVTDRNSNGATRLASIHDYAGRDSEDIEKRYYLGLYRGLPIRRGR